MSNEKKQKLMNLYENLDMNEELKSMKIGGMGLKNRISPIKITLWRKSNL